MQHGRRHFPDGRKEAIFRARKAGFQHRKYVTYQYLGYDLVGSSGSGNGAVGSGLAGEFDTRSDAYESIIKIASIIDNFIHMPYIGARGAAAREAATGGWPGTGDAHSLHRRELVHRHWFVASWSRPDTRSSPPFTRESWYEGLHAGFTRWCASSATRASEAYAAIVGASGTVRRSDARGHSRAPCGASSRFVSVALAGSSPPCENFLPAVHVNFSHDDSGRSVNLTQRRRL
jgi:hypothetical protein